MVFAATRYCLALTLLALPVFPSFSIMVPILSFKILPNVVPTVLSSVIPLYQPCLLPCIYSPSPPTCVPNFSHPVIQHNHNGNHSFSAVLDKFIHYLVCPCCLSILKFSNTPLLLPLWTLSVALLNHCLAFWCIHLRLRPGVDFFLKICERLVRCGRY